MHIYEISRPIHTFALHIPRLMVEPAELRNSVANRLQSELSCLMLVTAAD